MEMICTAGIKTKADLNDIQNSEVKDFLLEWLDEGAYVKGHTSGSTGKPKEIRLFKEDMLASARLTNRFFQINGESVLLLCLSVSYIAGKMMVVRALEAGARLLCVLVSSHPFCGLEGKIAKEITLAAMVPMQVEETLKVAAEKALLGKIRYLLVGGAAVPEAQEKQLQALPVCAYATYGMTETVSHVALRELNGNPVYFSLGKVRFTTDIRGCLVIEVPHLQVRRLVTNDLVRLVDATHFEWQGRYDHVINSAGIKFSPEVLEQKMAACIPGRFFITSRPDILLGEHVVLVLEGAVPEPAALEQLYSRLRICLHPYEMPREVFCNPVFLRTTSGKVKRTLEGASSVPWNGVG